MARKNLLLGISEKKLTAVNSADPGQALRTPTLATRGGLGAVTRTIDDLAAEAKWAKVSDDRAVDAIRVEVDDHLAGRNL